MCEGMVWVALGTSQLVSTWMHWRELRPLVVQKAEVTNLGKTSQEALNRGETLYSSLRFQVQRM